MKKKITIDSKEKDDIELVKVLRSKDYLDVTKENLLVGDYIVGNFIIERKTTADFISSFYDNRLKNQTENLELLHDSGYTPVLLIEGNWYKGKNGRSISWTQINNALNIIQFSMGIHVMFAENAKQSAYRLISLCFFDPTDQLKVARKSMKKEWTLREKQEYLLKSFRGVGDATVETILNMQSPIDFFNDVVTHTPKTAVKKQIKEVLTGERV